MEFGWLVGKAGLVVGGQLQGLLLLFLQGYPGCEKTSAAVLSLHLWRHYFSCQKTPRSFRREVERERCQ